MFPNTLRLAVLGAPSGARTAARQGLRLPVHVRNVGPRPGARKMQTSPPLPQAEIAAARPTEQLTAKQLRGLFAYSAVPMIGFGFMDNVVMVTAGDLIDNTLGVKFGLATLTAAACGQVVSDVCGVAFGGTVEALATKLGLTMPELTRRQRGLRVTKLTSTAGAVVGVICGCILGMSTLLFIDTTSKEREKKQREMDSLFATIMDDGHDLIGTEKCSLFFVDREKGELWSKVATDGEGQVKTAKLITVPIERGIVGEVVRTKRLINVAEAHKDSRFFPDVDIAMRSTTNNILAVPVLSRSTGDVLAVIEMINKHDGPFTRSDELLCTMLAAHVAVFLKQLGEDDGDGSE